MGSKFNLLVIVLLLIIFFLLSAIYFQKKDLNTTKVIATIKNVLKDSTGQKKISDSKRSQKSRQIYYIDQTKGDNDDAGNSITRPWKDFSMLRKKRFLPGDKILLKRGEVWHQTLVTPEGGRKTQPVIIDAYGNGSPPVIDVQNNHTYGIRINDSYTSVNNINVMNSQNDGIVVIAYSGGFRNVYLNNVNVFNAGKNGISVHNGGAHLQIRNCYIENSRNNGIHLGGSVEHKLSHVIVSGCHIKKVKHNDGITIHEDSHGNDAGSNFLLKNNISEMCGEEGFDVTAGRDVLLLNNISRNNGKGGVVVGHSVQNVTIKGHTSSNEPVRKTSAAMNLGGGGNIRLLNSVIKGNGYHLLKIRTSNVAVYNNNFVWNGGSSPIDLRGKIENIHFMNNIVYSKQEKMSRIRFLEPSRPPDYKTFYFDYNIYYAPDNHVIFYHHNKNYTFKKYKKHFKIEENSQNINPEFADASRNQYQLQNNSPAINKGCFLTRILPGGHDSIKVKNAIFFYKDPISDNFQCIMLKGVKDIFKVSGVNYQNNTIMVDKDINSSLPNAVGLCYGQFSPDIGRYEY